MEKQLEEEVEPLLSLAIAKDESEKDSEQDITEEIKRREDRLAKIKEAKKSFRTEASGRCKKEKEEYDAKMAQREEKEKSTGKKVRGKNPQAPLDKPNDKDQYIFPDRGRGS